MPAPFGHEPYNVNGEGGRPTEFTDEIIDQYAEEFRLWLKNPKNIWYQDFCLDKDINPDYMSIWADKNKRFFGVYEIAKHRQKSRLINGGLQSELNTGIVKLVLANAHNWTEKQETKVSGPDPTNPTPYWVPEANGTSKELVNEPTT